MTREEIRQIFPDIEDDKLKQILDFNSRDIGKAKEESKKFAEEITKLKEEITKKEEIILNFEKNSDDIEKLKKEIESYKKAEEERIKKVKEEEIETRISTAIDEVLNGKEFVNDMTRKGYINAVKSELAKEENAGKGIKEIFGDMTKDVEEIFKNPQQQIVIPKTGNINTTQIYSKEQIESMTPEEINKNWENVKQSLKHF